MREAIEGGEDVEREAVLLASIIKNDEMPISTKMTLIGVLKENGARFDGEELRTDGMDVGPHLYEWRTSQLVDRELARLIKLSIELSAESKYEAKRGAALSARMFMEERLGAKRVARENPSRFRTEKGSFVRGGG